MYGHHLEQSKDQPGMVANPACGQLNRENYFRYFSVPFIKSPSFGHHAMSCYRLVA